METKEKEQKKISLWSIILFNVCSIVILDTVASSASMGVPGISLWLIGLLFFFVPYGLISSELGSTWPQAGGIYVWTKQAFGDFAGTMVSWLYWINVVYWMPAVYVSFSGTMSSVFFPSMSSVGQALVSIILIWITVFLGVRSFNLSERLSGIGAFVKVALLSILGILGVVYGFRYGLANNFTLPSWKISLDNTLSFAPVVVYNLLGFEVISSVGDKFKNPKKDVPKAVILSGLMIAFVYIFSIFGILSVIKAGEINIVTGITDAFHILCVRVLGSAGNVVYILCVIGFLFTLVANMVAWSVGGNNVIGETGLDKKAKILGHKHPKYKTPDYPYYIMGVVGTLIVITNFVGIANIQQIFWTIFAFSSIVFLIPYIFMFAAVLKLRYSMPEVERPYRIPFGKLGVWICTILGEISLISALVFFFLPPSETENVLRYEISLIGGLIITVGIGVWIHVKDKVKHKSEVNVTN